MATSIAVAGGWELVPASILWGALAARAVPSVLYVRARIRLEKGRPHRVAPVIGAHVAALLLVAAWVAAGRLTWLVATVFALLLVRAAGGLSPLRRPGSITRVGIGEMVWGVLTVLAIAFGIIT